ncbi:MAG: 16S rRNA (cytidine(1402)-2'-O)-methyltransferase [Vicinamibacterales bacterium]
MTGTLFVVATPIGNLEDITLRALRILRESTLILAEDTRRTAGLLAHYGIATRTESYHGHSEHSRLPALMDRLSRGERLALVSDAGMPLVSDPGAPLVSAARAAGHRVEVIPGPSAVTTALVSTGWSVDSFVYLGFPPRQASQKRSWLRGVAAEPRMVVFFEAPHRMADTLAACQELFPERRLAVARELTKVHEELSIGTAAELSSRLHPFRGEFTVVVEPVSAEAGGEHAPITDDQLWREFCSLTADAGTDRRAAVTLLGRRYGKPSREIYAALERAKAAET